MTEVLSLELFDSRPLMTMDELRESESVVQRGLETYIEVGSALSAIRDGKGYRFTHGTFAEYVEQRWKMSIRTAYENITAAQVAQNVRTSAQIGMSQANILAKLPVEQQQKFVESHDMENMSVRQTNEAVKEWEDKIREAEQRAERAEKQAEKANKDAVWAYDQKRDLEKRWNEKVEQGIQEKLEPAKESLRSEIESEINKKYRENIKLLESTNSKLAKDSERLRELEQSEVWEVAGARNEVTRIMNKVYGDATKAFAEIETTYLEKLSPDMNTTPVLNHIAEQFIGMGERIQSWLTPNYNDTLVIEGDYVDV